MTRSRRAKLPRFYRRGDFRRQVALMTAQAKYRMRARAFVRDLLALCEKHGASIEGSSQYAYENWFSLKVRGRDVGGIEVDPSDGTAKWSY